MLVKFEAKKTRVNRLFSSNKSAVLGTERRSHLHFPPMSSLKFLELNTLSYKRIQTYLLVEGVQSLILILRYR